MSWFCVCSNWHTPDILVIPFMCLQTRTKTPNINNERTTYVMLYTCMSICYIMFYKQFANPWRELCPESEKPWRELCPGCAKPWKRLCPGSAKPWGELNMGSSKPWRELNLGSSKPWSGLFERRELCPLDILSVIADTFLRRFRFRHVFQNADATGRQQNHNAIKVVRALFKVFKGFKFKLLFDQRIYMYRFV